MNRKGGTFAAPPRKSAAGVLPFQL